jgi:uncharacterized protein YndB with AHSA1/START domain
MRRSLLAVLVVLAGPAAAQALPPYGSFEVVIDRKLNVPPDMAWDQLVHVERWWTSSHTYSGDAANLNLEARAGGCWCENWLGGSVEHARVLTALPGKLLRVSGGFGPLQAQPVVAVLSFGLQPADDGKATMLAVRYRVAGPVGTLGPPVTDVLTSQVENLVTGLNAPAPVSPKP